MLNQTSVNASTNTTITSETKTETKQDTWVYACLMMDGRIAIGSAKNASREIAKLNSGMFPAVPKSHQMYSIIGVKPINEDRNLPSVVARFCQKYGSEKIITI